MPGIKKDYLALIMATMTAESYIGHWYRWGGDDPAGFDCSGFVIECLQSAGKLPAGDWKARQLHNLFKEYKVKSPEKGCLVFVLRNDCVIHVEFCLNDRFAIGAIGGSSDIIDKAGKMMDIDNKSVEEIVLWLGKKFMDKERAAIENAFIKIRPLTRWTPETYRLEYVDPFLILT